MSETIDVLGKGFVRLDACMADDASVVNAARVSFAKQSSEIHEELSGKDKGLIGFLMRERHGTPFEHNAFRFHIKCPIFVAREWFRHRIGSFNEFSARYSEVPSEFHIPELNHVRTQVGKPGSYSFKPFEDQEDAMHVLRLMHSTTRIAFDAYDELLRMGVAKEVARMVLPVASFTQFYWTVNARALMNFMSLRTDANAQFEIREYAKAVEQLFSAQMPVTHEAWVDNGRVAP